MDFPQGMLTPSPAPAALFTALILLSTTACGPPADSAPPGGEAAGTAGTVFPPTNRPDVRGISGAVSAGHPLAAAAGHEVLRRGGNAMGPGSTAYLHALIEMKKLAFADRDQWAADPEFTDIPLADLLDPAYLAQRAAMVDPNTAAESREPGVRAQMTAGSRTPGAPTRIADATDEDPPDDSGDTVYLTAVDRWGNAVSWIQSLFAGFGSGLLEPETGVVLHNRGALFNLEPGHPNIIAPGKRPYHTLTPMMALNADGSFAFTLGTPGGDSQPQSLLQIVSNLVHFGMTPQAAIEAPRFRSYNGLRVAFEDRFPAVALGELMKLGHEVDVVHGWTATFGGAQMILRDRDGTLTAASDPRREAYAIAW